ncbi:MAG: TetR/AcrR family transcriptional regulator [Candidatus Dormibacteraeota bacterium]|nr:TetR/AcrR family transcriptional regulator [Candidatus Dormibacteraeota bacterium]
MVTKRSVRENLLTAAYELFSQKGIKAVGVDEIIGRAGVAKMTFYRHFPTKDDLVLAFLERREQLWTREWLEAEISKRGGSPKERLLTIFDIFDEWFNRNDFEACSFIRTMFETLAPEESRVLSASRAYLANIRDVVQRLAEEAEVPRPAELAAKWQLLMAGSIVAAAYGDRKAARHAKETAELL